MPKAKKAPAKAKSRVSKCLNSQKKWLTRQEGIERNEVFFTQWHGT